MRYIIDTDPGIDDAIAISLAIRNNMYISGFTLATGNVALEKSEKNLKIIQEFLGTNIKMYKGEKENKCNENAEYAHGVDGLGYAVFPDFSKKKFEKISAEDFIIKSSKKYKDDLTIICLGPLTNLANAIRKDKDLSKRLKHVVLMGATYNENNTKPYYEFNVNVDKEAAKLVFESGISDIKIVTHDIGIKSFIEKDYVLNLRNSSDFISRFIGLISEKYIEFSYDHYRTIGLGTPDPTTIAGIIDEKILTFKPCSIKIVTMPNKKALCKVKLKNESNIKISTDFDLERFRSLFKKTFK